MYDLAAQFFPQFLTFKMAEESVAREDVPSNLMLMAEIRSLKMLPVELVFRGIFSSSHLLQLHLSSYISHHKDESKRKLALQRDDRDLIHITNDAVEKIAPIRFAFRANLSTPAIHRRCAGDPLNRSPNIREFKICLLYTSPSPRDLSTSRMPSSA